MAHTEVELAHELNEALETIAERDARIEELEKALAFYAEPETYFGIAFFADNPSGDFHDDTSETSLGIKPGRRARLALNRGLSDER